MTIVLSIQYIGIDTENSKPLIKNNKKVQFLIKNTLSFANDWHILDKLCQTSSLLPVLLALSQTHICVFDL